MRIYTLIAALVMSLNLWAADSSPALWVHAATERVEAVKEFYGKVFGWEFEDQPDQPSETLIKKDGQVFAALRQIDYQGGQWTPYVWVDDIEGTTKRARDRGAKVFEYFIEDPVMGMVSAWQPPTSARSSARTVPGAPDVFWMEVATADEQAAIAFYGSVFGWDFAENKKGGQTYTSIIKNGREVGAIHIHDSQGGNGPTRYLRVDNLEQALEMARQNGATDIQRIEEPNGIGQKAVFKDPGGMWMALYQP